MGENGEKLANGRLGQSDKLAAAPLTKPSIKMMQMFASEYIKAGLAPEGSTEGALILKIQTGREIGLPPMAAMRHLYVVKGKVAMEGEAMLALILADPRCVSVDYGWDEETKTGFCHMVRSQPAIDHRAEFSLADAGKASLTGKDIWKAYPQIMCPWRAVSIAARRVWADVILGVYLPEEVGLPVEVDAGTQEVKVISLEVDEEPDEQAAEPEEQSDEAAELVAQIKAAGETLGYSKAKVQSDIASTDGTADQLGCLFNEYDEKVVAGYDGEPAPEAGEVNQLFKEEE